MRYAWYESPIGRLLVAKDDVAVRHVAIPDRDPVRADSPRRGVEGSAEPEPGPEWRRDDAGLAREVGELDAYFAGELREFEMAVEPVGTAFRGRVRPPLPAFPTVRRGATGSSLGRRASAAGRRVRSGRRTREPVAIVLPCHRVIGADGRLVGYGGGLERKRGSSPTSGALSTCSPSRSSSLTRATVRHGRAARRLRGVVRSAVGGSAPAA